MLSFHGNHFNISLVVDVRFICNTRQMYIYNAYQTSVYLKLKIPLQLFLALSMT